MNFPGENSPSGAGFIWQVQIWEERKQKVVAELRCRNEVKGVCLHRAARLKKPHKYLHIYGYIPKSVGVCVLFFFLFLLSAEDIIVMVCEYVIYVYTSGDVKACCVFTRARFHTTFSERCNFLS